MLGNNDENKMIKDFDSKFRRNDGDGEEEEQ